MCIHGGRRGVGGNGRVGRLEMIVTARRNNHTVASRLHRGATPVILRLVFVLVFTENCKLVYHIKIVNL